MQGVGSLDGIDWLKNTAWGLASMHLIPWYSILPGISEERETTMQSAKKHKGRRIICNAFGERCVMGVDFRNLGHRRGQLYIVGTLLHPTE